MYLVKYCKNHFMNAEKIAGICVYDGHLIFTLVGGRGEYYVHPDYIYDFCEAINIYADGLPLDAERIMESIE